MQILCDVCEATAATLFCPADEAALCASCDVKVSSSLFLSFFLFDIYILLGPSTCFWRLVIWIKVHELAPFYDYKVKKIIQATVFCTKNC